MYTYNKWDKKEDINGVSSDKWILDTPRMNTEDSILIFATNDPQERVSMIFLEGELRQSYNDYTSTIEQLAELKVASLNGSAPGSLIVMQSKIDILEQQDKESKDKISILEAEKEELKKVTKEQDDLLVDNTYKITMLEMNLGGK